MWDKLQKTNCNESTSTLTLLHYIDITIYCALHCIHSYFCFLCYMNAALDIMHINVFDTSNDIIVWFLYGTEMQYRCKKM